MVSLITREFHNFEQKLPFKINNNSCKKSFGFVMESTFPTHRWLWCCLLGICQTEQGAKKYPLFHSIVFVINLDTLSALKKELLSLQIKMYVMFVNL